MFSCRLSCIEHTIRNAACSLRVYFVMFRSIIYGCWVCMAVEGGLWLMSYRLLVPVFTLQVQLYS